MAVSHSGRLHFPLDIGAPHAIRNPSPAADRAFISGAPQMARLPEGFMRAYDSQGISRARRAALRLHGGHDDAGDDLQQHRHDGR